jgi:hypothetical protein
LQIGTGLAIDQDVEGKTMKKGMAVMMLLAGGLFAAPRVSVGFGFGAPAPVTVARPACPGPGYSWVDGYYAPTGAWVAGYWTPPATVRVAPGYERGRVIDHASDRGHFDGREHFNDRDHADHFRR